MRGASRLTALALLFAFVLPSAAGGSVLLLGGPRLVDCVEASDVQASAGRWSPECVGVVSGDVVVFRADASAHDPASDLDASTAAAVGAPRCFAAADERAPIPPGGAYTVRFVLDANGLTASSRGADGTFSAARDCLLARDPAQSTPTRAVVPFSCRLHEGMPGAVVVHALG